MYRPKSYLATNIHPQEGGVAEFAVIDLRLADGANAVLQLMLAPVDHFAAFTGLPVIVLVHGVVNKGGTAGVTGGDGGTGRIRGLGGIGGICGVRGVSGIRGLGGSRLGGGGIGGRSGLAGGGGVIPAAGGQKRHHQQADQ